MFIGNACVSIAVQHRLLLLRDIFPSHGMSEKNQKSDNSQFPIILIVVKTFSASCFLDSGLMSQQGTIQIFGTESNLKGLPLTSKATSGFFGQNVWNWIKGNVPGFEKFRSDTNNKGFT